MLEVELILLVLRSNHTRNQPLVYIVTKQILRVLAIAGQRSTRLRFECVAECLATQVCLFSIAADWQIYLGKRLVGKYIYW